MNDSDSVEINTSIIHNLRDLRVCDLMLPETGSWNRVLLDFLFIYDDVSWILRTPLPPLGVKDNLIWHHFRDRKYSVKYGYQLASNLFVDKGLEVTGNRRAL